MISIVAVVIVRSLACIICLGIAGYIAIQGLEGWGWFLLVALWLGAYTISDRSEGE